MRRQYDTRLANFYEEHPTLRPVKPDKAKKALVRTYLKLKISKHGLLIEIFCILNLQLPTYKFLNRLQNN